MTKLLKSCTAIVATAVIASQALAGEMITKIGPGEGQVNIVAWPGYIERGETVAEFDWVTRFKEATRCKVNASWCRAIGMTPSSRSTISRTRAWWRRGPGRSR